ncbi:MAG: ribosome recycling factor [Candidatus Goldbacteria bacterium]|nr:ribosome recycling factor [Candidatus Goldiibacteriota bacterium]HPD19229.1 ribosome recycling factor [Candidatus Goldiibacteriota bacterium]
MENVIKEMEVKMKKAIDVFQQELLTFRTGRANTAILNDIFVECYENKMPINQVASLSVIEAKTIDVRPWDKNILQNIEKAILAANLGLGVVNTGDSLKLKFPELTEETRKEMVKKVKKMSEETKINLRNIRREANEKIKNMEKNKQISEDDLKYGESKTQKITDKYIADVDNLVKIKEQDLMTI